MQLEGIHAHLKIIPENDAPTLPPEISCRRYNRTGQVSMVRESHREWPQAAATRKETQLTKARTPRLLGALAALGALTIVGAGGGAASASTSGKVHATVIKMKQDGKNLFFEGPATVPAGATLKIKNVTDPRKIGPHTFSLVRKNDIPTDASDIKDCEKKFALICGAIIEWHEVDLQTGEVGVNPVEVGDDGWDTEGSLKRKGDSWVAEAEGQTFKQKVSAPEGTTLHYFCAVHAFMQGKIKVEG